MARFHRLHRLHRLGNWPRWRSWAALLALGLAAHAPAGAWEASGTQTITAHTRDGGRVQLGTVRFDPQPDGWSTFQIRMTPGLLKDHFLSMKEFKCSLNTLAARLTASSGSNVPFVNTSNVSLSKSVI